MDTKYDTARREVLSAGDDWAKMLDAAQTLAGSPDYTDQVLAGQIERAYQRRLRELEAETPAQIANRIVRSDWPTLALGAVCGVALAYAVLVLILGVGK